jgi:prephenate dehydrogenase
MIIGVYGLGRFGNFWASVLAHRHEVLVYNRSPGRPTPEGAQAVSREELLERSETVFLCCAISALDSVLQEIAPLVRPGQIVADTCSVKVVPARQMQERLPQARLLATHPMFGPDSARAGLKGLPIVLHNLQQAEKAFQFWKKEFLELELCVLEMTPEEHDREAAYTQGVTHFIGRVLSDMGLKEHPIATQGYRKLLEIVAQTCNDPFQLFLDLQTYNPYTPAMRQDLQRSLDHVQEQLSASLDSPLDPR